MTVICSRYGLGQQKRTLRKVAPIPGVSAERVREIEQESLAKLYVLATSKTGRSVTGHAPGRPASFPADATEQRTPPWQGFRRMEAAPASCSSSCSPRSNGAGGTAVLRLEQLARRRAMLARQERSTASELLRSHAVEIRNELVRLNLVGSLITKLPQPLSPRSRATTGGTSTRGS